MILVTGGAGAMGADLTRGLVRRNFPVRVLALPGDPCIARLQDLDCEIVEGDITRPDSLTAACAGVRTVYHLAAVVLARRAETFQKVNVQGVRNVLEASRDAGAKHFIYVSSASVLYPRATDYSRSKLAGERLVRSQTSVPYTIVRPTLAYNEFGGEEFQMFVRTVLKFPLVPVIGKGDSLKAPVHTADLVAAFIALAENPAAYGQTYHLSGGEEISMLDLTKLILEIHGARRPILHIPTALCRLVAALCEAIFARPPLTWQAVAGLTQDANLDNRQSRRDLGYQPRGVREGLRQCFDRKPRGQASAKTASPAP